MPSEPDPISEPLEESELCLSCMAPNDTGVPFCAKCGAPMTSYASTGPLEHIFAEGYAYRQAAERPRSFIVVLGIWMIFVTLAMAGGMSMWMGYGTSLPHFAMGVFLTLVSVIIIARTTRNYFARPPIKEPSDSDVSD
ncbi:hypothetical protein BH11VER1_BH11VER1_38580 [soil metagenome]